jgi:hypothetical protein
MHCPVHVETLRNIWLCSGTRFLQNLLKIGDGRNKEQRKNERQKEIRK